jgi:hypothetical protein
MEARDGDRRALWLLGVIGGGAAALLLLSWVIPADLKPILAIAVLALVAILGRRHLWLVAGTALGMGTVVTAFLLMLGADADVPTLVLGIASLARLRDDVHPRCAFGPHQTQSQRYALAGSRLAIPRPPSLT